MMGQLVVLNLGQGNWQQGFPTVTVQLWETSKSTPIQFTGSLPANSKLPNLYRHWQSIYEALSSRLSRRRIEIEEEAVTNVSEAKLNEICQQLKDQLDNWLETNSFSKIERRLRTELKSSTEIRVIIETEDKQLRRFPWHLWSFFEDYPQAEVALGTQEYGRAGASSPSTTGQVRILAILGNSEGIEVHKDRALLKQLPGVDIELLVEPTRAELDRALWNEKGWDILFFAGHSTSRANDTSGQIAINRTSNLTISQLKNALRTAIQRRLKFAIFNSCDGLGLAREMADLNIPQVIVMREPVPDCVAHEFLKHFLFAFTDDKSFYLSVREAREKLQGLEDQFPCASWLPVICQNPAEAPPTWKELCNKSVQKSLIASLKFNLRPVLITGIAVLAIVMGVRQLGVLQPWELVAFDYLLRLRPKELPDSRLVVITVTAKDVDSQTEKQGSLSNRSLAQLLDKLEPYGPALIGVDIYRSFPVEPQYKSLEKRLRQDENLVTICDTGQNDSTPGFSPPVEVPKDRLNERVGFSDIVLDEPSGVVRRQLLGHAPPRQAACQTTNSFSLLLALRYLYKKDPSIEVAPVATGMQIGRVLFKSLDDNAGGYQMPLRGQGYQILLNYRNSDKIAPQLTLEEVMNGKTLSSEFLKDRIVLVGTIDPRFKDFHFTPYNQSNFHKMPGVIVQAHMVSQILSAVLDDRPLLWWWAEWAEGLWILGWSIVGGLIACYSRSLVVLVLATGIAFIALIACCYVLLLRGGWIPLVPPILSLIVAEGLVLVYVKSHTVNGSHPLIPQTGA